MGESEAQHGVLITFLYKFTLKILVKDKNARLKTELRYQGCSFPNKMSVKSEGLFWFPISSELLISFDAEDIPELFFMQTLSYNYNLTKGNPERKSCIKASWEDCLKYKCT